jgi:hypothetical protein
MSTTTEETFLPIITPAVVKFYELNDDMRAVQAVTNRVFFEFLRTKPSLTESEIDMLWSVAELLGDVCGAKPRISNQ